MKHEACLGLHVMKHVLYMYEEKVYMCGPCSVKKGLKAFAKSIDPCQPAQSAQADMGRNFSHDNSTVGLNPLFVKMGVIDV